MPASERRDRDSRSARRCTVGRDGGEGGESRRAVPPPGPRRGEGGLRRPAPVGEPAPLVIGVGNPDGGDDAAGRAVARRLRELLAGGVDGAGAARPAGGGALDVAEADGEATRLLALMEGRERVILVDAARSGAAPGTVHRFDAAAGPLPASLATASSHGLGPAQAVELARALGRLPTELTVVAVEGERFDEPGLSPPVAAAVERLAAELARSAVDGRRGAVSPGPPESIPLDPPGRVLVRSPARR